mgnify:CR=1 FL=1
MHFIKNSYVKTFDFLSMLFLPLVLLAMRLWMAKIFWDSGQTKIADWNSTVALFKDIYTNRERDSFIYGRNGQFIKREIVVLLAE